MEKDDVIKKLASIARQAAIVYDDYKIMFVSHGDLIEYHDDYLVVDWLNIEYGSINDVVQVTKGTYVWPTWGSDPEFFFEKEGKIVPSSRVIPPYTELVVRDGIQGELNPETDTCRQVSGNKIYHALGEALTYARRVGARILLSAGVTVDKETFYSLPPNERQFGCSPTLNVHEKTKRAKGTRTLFRAGGGHIHAGSSKIVTYYEQDPKKLISLLDIVCGVACVLIDRDPANIQRRKNYGRAGEHRKKSYGLEYRVPSNFWLKHYTLWSMVTGLMRNAFSLFELDAVTADIFNEIDMKDVRDAINNNDKELALKVYRKYTDILKKHHVYFGSGVEFTNADLFLQWASMEDPMRMFDIDDSFSSSMRVWENHYEYEDVYGFESFLTVEFGNGDEYDY